MDGEQVEWASKVGGSCRGRVVGVGVSVVDRFQQFWYRSLGPTVLVVTGTVGWQVEVEGQGRELLDTGRKQPPEETTRRTGQIRGSACGSCSACCNGERTNSLNGSQCCIDSGSRWSKSRACVVFGRC